MSATGGDMACDDATIPVQPDFVDLEKR